MRWEMNPSLGGAQGRKSGESIRSRNPTALVNEFLAQVVCYNLSVLVHEVFENGVAPEFPKQDEEG